MSETRRKKPPTGKAAGRTGRQYEDDYDYEQKGNNNRQRRRAQARYGDEEEYYDDRPQGRAPSRQSHYGSRYARPRRDPFPIILGGLIGALVVGLAVVVFLLASNSNGGSASTSTGSSSSSNNPPAGNTGSSGSSSQGGQSSSSSSSTPPRMPLADFLKQYNDPAKRPYIIDVRSVDQYNEGHIKGAVSHPLADVSAWAVKVPKDRLVVAYCQ